MVGNARTREKLTEAHDEIARLKAKLARFEHDGRAKRTAFHERQYDESILDDLIEWSSEGQFLDEILAQWGISRETFDEWMSAHPKLAELFPKARTLARSAILRHMRLALETKSAFPASLADRLVGIIDREMSGADDEDASGLIRVDVVAPAVKAETAREISVTPQRQPDADAQSAGPGD